MSKKKNSERTEPIDQEKLGNKTYLAELKKLHIELVKLQEWVVHAGKKVVIVFEGRDTAGKGGTIKAITERVSPRIFRVVALPAPNDREKSQMYVQRYLPHLPAAGEVVIFDRSWYNRAGVERVMGFTDEKTVKHFLEILPMVENAIVSSGVILLKYWLDVSPEEQTKPKSRPSGFRRASTMAARCGSSRRWISNRTRAGPITPPHATTCSSTPTATGRPGSSRSRTTRSAPG